MDIQLDSRTAAERALDDLMARASTTAVAHLDATVGVGTRLAELFDKAGVPQDPGPLRRPERRRTNGPAPLTQAGPFVARGATERVISSV